VVEKPTDSTLNSMGCGVLKIETGQKVVNGAELGRLRIKYLEQKLMLGERKSDLIRMARNSWGAECEKLTAGKAMGTGV